MISRNERVAWRDGMLLLPQHLQYQDNVVYRHLARLVQGAQPYPHGLVRLDLDESLLLEGRISISWFEAVIPGLGLTWCGSKSGEVLGRELNTEADFVKVYVGVQNAVSRVYRSCTKKVSDIIETDAHTEVETLVDDLQVLIGDDECRGFHVCLVACLERVEGRFQLSEGEAPSSLRVGAVQSLLRRFRRAGSTLARVVDALRARPASPGLGNVLAPLRVRLEHQLAANVHPFSAWSTLAEAIAAMDSEASLPLRYRHQALGSTMKEIETQLGVVTAQYLETVETELVLEPRDTHSLRLGLTGKASLMGVERARLIFYMRRDEDSLTCESLARICKFAPEDSFEQRLDRALPGVALRPSRARLQANERVLELDSKSAGWQELQAAKSAALFVPAEVLKRVERVSLERLM